MVSNTKLAIALATVCCFVVVVRSQHVGGLSSEKPSDAHLEGVLEKAMPKLRDQFPGGFKKIEPISYKTQVVSGMNYFIKVKVTDNEDKVKPAHLRLYRSFSRDVEVHGIKTDVLESSPLKYFQADR